MLRVEDLAFKVYSCWFRVQGFGCKVPGFRVWGGLRAAGLRVRAYDRALEAWRGPKTSCVLCMALIIRTTTVHQR